MKKTTWIVRTAVCLALLLVLQVATKSLGQFVTGSCVNLVLAMAALSGGLWSGVAVAVLSPFCAYALGIGPAFLQLVPCVALGNAVYAVLFALLVGKWLTAKPLAAWGSMPPHRPQALRMFFAKLTRRLAFNRYKANTCLLYTSPSPRD